MRIEADDESICRVDYRRFKHEIFPRALKSLKKRSCDLDPLIVWTGIRRTHTRTHTHNTNMHTHTHTPSAEKRGFTSPSMPAIAVLVAIPAVCIERVRAREAERQTGR